MSDSDHMDVHVPLLDVVNEYMALARDLQASNIRLTVALRKALEERDAAMARVRELEE